MHRGKLGRIGAVVMVALLPAGSAGAHVGYGIVVDHAGRVCFLDAPGGRVWRVNADGRLTALASKHGDNLVQDADGNLYVEHTNESLWRIEPGGRVAEVRIPGKPRAVGALDELVAVDREGSYYFAAGNEFVARDPRLLKMAPTGKVTLLAGSTRGHADGQGSAAQFTRIAAAAWGPQGELYVTDATSVRKVPPDGTVTTLASGLGTENAANPPLGGLLGLALDARGNTYVADSGRATVHRITPAGAIRAVMRASPPWVPVGVAISADTLYVLERALAPRRSFVHRWLDTVRVRRMAGGRVTTLATVRSRPGWLGLAAAALALSLLAAGVGVHTLRRKRAVVKRAESR
jgi:sugar lactone lactonase YvrE